ncbi:hypothetical protein BTR23_06770 [Alkalihalophilus pseudofirmus]|uniref:type II toxin-antitoxin system HicB family antitoxin n=1 Tax=Alkalihalobacterium alkalinitrilicum TaxID=427920 RepID=UPI00094D10E1|nr:hypothetical protein [Alkalihalobacterium alkalinitrilicum]OLO40196.1 hypothetical protein BTR23_06770 [Alkalihalophilus pseudofirmus]
MNYGHQEFQNILDLQQYSWLVRRQFNWKGHEEYSIEVKGLDGCIGYGDTYKEAKEDLAIAVQLWLKKQGLTEIPKIKGRHRPLLMIEPAMSKGEFEQVNIVIKEWNE